ncbi:MAG: sigma-54-dependent Fis family transcriptional regulator [Desulfuromonadales bacterium]|nr:MAG: sigma-54-dependent Fis family transcriptional regulator [Desulfuromonadales bacterium]
MLRSMLRKSGYEADEAPDGEAAFARASATRYDFILCDIRMPVLDGVGFLRKVQEAGIGGTVIMMSAYGTIDTAVQCMKEGAYDYVSKPFRTDEILLVLRKAEERERLKHENRRLREEVEREYSFGSIVSRSSRMKGIFQLIRRVCDVKTTILILGESGTGKELVARAIHHNGSRRDGPFVAVNCGAIPENLLESELFGHVRGAFTDAAADRQGLFEEANGGTLFLDEIGEMPLTLQVKLLRVLQEGEIRRVGAAKPTKVDVRVISATARDLQKDTAAGRFREDLFFRLNVFSITLPPLRDRLEDVPLLVNHFLAKHGSQLAKSGLTASPEVLRMLMGYSWPGNVRELENCIERSLILCDGGTIGTDCLPEHLCSIRSAVTSLSLPDDSLSIKKAEELLERDYIRRALHKTGGNRTHAARLLEISHRALLYKLKEYGME